MFFLAVPIVVLVALAHRLLQTYAPSNVLIACVRASRPTICMAARIGVLVIALLFAARVLSLALSNGAPGWLNLIVLILTWDAIKIGLCACVVGGRWFFETVRRGRAR
jgi:hypothetical protein